MFVHAYMTPDPIVISPDDNFPQAMNAMRKHNIRHIPVVEGENLVGILVERDLLSYQPSPVSALNLVETYSLLESMRVRQIMSRPVITVEGDCPLEEAARIMSEHAISCLPVMEEEKLVGIITETDVFKALMETLGGGEQGTRLTLELEEKVGELARIAGLIAQAGGNILAVTTSKVQESGLRQVTIKEDGSERQKLLSLLEESGVRILDLRPSGPYEPRLFG